MSIKKMDWRADIRKYSSLYDMDLSDLMVFIRHEYIKTAKDLMKSYNPEDQRFAEKLCQSAEYIEAALEDLAYYKPVNSFLSEFKPSFIERSK